MFFFLLSAALAQPTAPSAQPAACAATDQSLPASLVPWISPAPLAGAIRPGQAVTVPLSPATTLQTHVPIHPAREGTTTGAAVDLEIDAAGTYGVALDIGAWIEMVSGTQSIRSAAHGHGPACSTIRKIVDFQLAPGTYRIELSGTSAAAARLLVIRR